MNTLLKNDFFQLTIIIVCVCIVFLIVIVNYDKYKNCHYEKYNEYPCEGATHYARVHRNNNQPCERYKRICN